MAPSADSPPPPSSPSPTMPSSVTTSTIVRMKRPQWAPPACRSGASSGTATVVARISTIFKRLFLFLLSLAAASLPILQPASDAVEHGKHGAQMVVIGWPRPVRRRAGAAPRGSSSCSPVMLVGAARPMDRNIAQAVQMHLQVFQLRRPPRADPRLDGLHGETLRRARTAGADRCGSAAIDLVFDEVLRSRRCAHRWRSGRRGGPPRPRPPRG